MAVTPRVRVAPLIAWLVAVAAAFPAHAQDVALEYAVKAAYLYKFEPFVTWPPGTFAAPTSPFNLCIVGDDPFGGLVERAVDGQRFDERPIAVRRLPMASRDAGCQLMYVAGSAAQPVAAALEAVRGAPVLTVTDVPDGAPHGIINFVRRDERVRFEIDEAAAAGNGLAISSKLLSLAVGVTPRQ